MGIYSKPIIFAILSIAVILIGTIITTIIPLFMSSTQPVSKYIKPYTAVELEGRDIYIREGCNNCHSQTVRPLRTEVARYGEYSKPEEFAYDRPFLWGSRRIGPDLARVGGKYPDSWHYQHLYDPRSMFSKSIMPSYGWLAKRKLNTKYTFKKISILNYGYSKEEVRKQIDDYRAKVISPTYTFKEVRDNITPPELRKELTEMDALVAYLQKLGRDIKKVREKSAIKVARAASKEEIKNPHEGDNKAIAEGRSIFMENCSVCHGEDARGKIGPSLVDNKWKYGDSDKDLYESISKGRSGGMPAWETMLGKERIWKVIAFLRSIGEK
jgi:cytochrome c oxidase cbb3-type subunit 2